MMQRQLYNAIALILAGSLFVCEAWSPVLNHHRVSFSRTSRGGSDPTKNHNNGGSIWTLSALGTNEERKVETKVEDSPEETTKKFGLEAGIFQSLKQNDGGESAKSLLKRYGIAYLATSIPLALLSFAICYALVDNGVDVAGLLRNLGIDSTTTSETAGTVAIAYAAHKAASPIRFPPTVLLTPVVAKLIGKEPNEEEEEES